MAKALGFVMILSFLSGSCKNSPTEVCAGPFEVTEPGIVAPTRVSAPAPQYTEEARRARVQGVVIAEGIVDCDGAFGNLGIVNGLGLGLDEATLDALSRWRFEPATRNGRKVSVLYTVTVTFRLQ